MIYWETLTLKTWPSEPNLTMVLVVLPQPGFLPPGCCITTTIDIIMCKVSSNKFLIDHMQGSNLQTAGSWAMTWRKHVSMWMFWQCPLLSPTTFLSTQKTEKKQLKRSLRNLDLGLRREGHKKKKLGYLPRWEATRGPLQGWFWQHPIMWVWKHHPCPMIPGDHCQLQQHQSCQSLACGWASQGQYWNASELHVSVREILEELMITSAQKSLNAH